MTDFKSSKLKSSKRVDASIARIAVSASQKREEHFVPRALSLFLFLAPLLWHICYRYTYFSNCFSLFFCFWWYSNTMCIFFYSRSDFYTRPLSALIRQRRRMVLPRRALSLFPALGRSRVYSVAIGVVPINTLEEARSRVLHFYPVKTNNFITPSKPDRAARLPFYTSHSGYAAQPWASIAYASRSLFKVIRKIYRTF